MRVEGLNDASEAEVAEAGFEFVGDENVGGFDVAMGNRWVLNVEVKKTFTGLLEL